MADFIDYSRIGAPSYGKEISALGDDLFESIKFRAQRDAEARKQTEDERHARELEGYNRSIAAATNRRLDEAEKRDQEKFNNDKNDRALKGTHEYLTALGRDDGSAPAIAAAYGLPVTVTNPFPKPEPPAPGSAPQPPGPEPQPGFVGPIQTLEQARQSARERAMSAGAAAAGGAPGAPTEPPPFVPGPAGYPAAPGPSSELTSPDAEAARMKLAEQGGERQVLDQQAQVRDYQTKLGAYRDEAASFPQRQADFQAKEQAYPREQRNWDEHAVHEITLPNGQKFQATVAEARYAARSKDAQDMRDALMPQLQQELAAARAFPTAEGRAVAEAEATRKINLASEVTSAVFAGAAKPADAFKAYQTAVAANQKQAFTGEQNALNRQAKHEDVQTMANRPQASISLQGQKLGLQTEEAGNREFNTFLTQQGYKTDAATLKTLGMTADALVKHNSALDVTAGAQFAKNAQGAGVLTDKDYDRFWGAIGGGEARPGDWFEMVVDGQMGEEKRRIVLEAVAHKVEQERTRYTQLAQQADKAFGSEPWYPRLRAAYFDVGQGLPPVGQQAGPRIGASAPPRSKGGGAVSGRASAAGAAVPTDENGKPSAKGLLELIGR